MTNEDKVYALETAMEILDMYLDDHEASETSLDGIRFAISALMKMANMHVEIDRTIKENHSLVTRAAKERTA